MGFPSKKSTSEAFKPRIGISGWRGCGTSGDTKLLPTRRDPDDASLPALPAENEQAVSAQAAKEPIKRQRGAV